MKRYEKLIERIERQVRQEDNLLANCANTAAFIYQMLEDISWVGFYFKDEKTDELVLGPFQGQPACNRIGYGRGVCGRAWQEARTIRVENVHDFEDHIFCDSQSMSEIVLPIIKEGKFYGVLDLDSYKLARFTTEDEEYLEKVRRIIEGFDWHA